MATLYPKRSGWIKQPHYPVGLSPEWASKIAFASLVGQNWNYDLKTRIRPSVVGTGLSKTVGQHGPATTASNDTSGLFWSTRTPIASGNDGYSMLLLAAPVSQSEVDRAIVLGDEASGAFNQITFAFNSDKDAAASAGKFAIFEYNSGFNNRADSTVSQVDGNWHVFIVNRDPGSAGQTKLYRDGIDVTGSQSHTGGNACTAGTSILCSPASTTAGFEHPASLAVVFNAPLTAAERATLSANPWVILESQARNIWIPDVGGGTTITGSPVNFQWETNTGSFKQKVETTPVNWNWFVTSGTVTENIKFTPVNFQWEVTSGSIQQGSATTITTTPVTWQWEQSSASFVTRIQSSPVNSQWESTASNIKEYVNSVPVTFQWQLTSGSILGTTAIDFNSGVWEWEITTGSIAYIQPAQTSGTIGGKKDKHLKLPFYDKGKKYDSRIDLDEVYQPAKSKLDDPVADRDLVGVDVRSDKHIDGDIDVRQDIKSDEPGGRLVSELLQEIKGQSQPVQIIALPEAINEEYDDSMVESLVVSLLLAA